MDSWWKYPIKNFQIYIFNQSEYGNTMRYTRNKNAPK